MSKQPRRILFVVTFVIIGITSEILFWKTNTNPLFVIILSPVLFAAHWLEGKFSFFPLTPVLDELIFVLPVNLLYFGLVGYWLKRVSEERGIMKFLLLLIVIVFIGYLHWQAAMGLREVFPFLEELDFSKGILAQ
jgi:hypothetical protein